MVITFNYHHNKVLFCSFIFVLSTVFCIRAKAENSVNLFLENFNKSDINGRAFFKYAELQPSDPVIIHIVNTSADVAYVIIQVHVQEWNVTLSTYNTTDKVSFSGSNIGLKLDSAMINKNNISVTNNYNSTTTALIAVVAYVEEAPTPGGCNNQKLADIIPFQKITTTNALVIIEAQLASTPYTGHQVLCDNLTSITYEVYRLYAPNYDFTNETYFSTISKMFTVDDIIKNGKKISLSISNSSLKMIYSTYLGVGSAYAVIAKYGNYSAAYVPTFSYGCDPLFNEGSCYFLNFTITKCICAFVFCCGIFLIFLGKRFFYGPMIVISTLIGSIIGYIVLIAIEISDINWLFGGSMLIGIIGSLAIAIMSCIIPYLIIFPASLSVGLLMASIMYFGMPDGVLLFKSDLTFWPIYGSVVFLALLPFSCTTPIQNNICCAILGSFGIILSIDYWAGFNLKYIVINTIRRLIVKDFNVAIISPPIRSADIWLCVFWIILILFAINHKPVSYIIITSKGILPKVSAPRGYRRVLPLRATDQISYLRA